MALNSWKSFLNCLNLSRTLGAASARVVTLMIVGLSASLPQSLYQGLVAHGVSPAAASKASHLPPVSTLFAAFLGYNPVQQLIGPHVVSQIPPAQQAVLSGRGFFPSIITAPFKSRLHAALDLAIVASLLAAAASGTWGGHADAKATTGTGPRAIGTHSPTGKTTNGKIEANVGESVGVPMNNPEANS